MFSSNPNMPGIYYNLFSSLFLLQKAITFPGGGISINIQRSYYEGISPHQGASSEVLESGMGLRKIEKLN